MKAMLLAAGRGARLKPITDNTPKPLINIGTESLIEHNIRHLKACGVNYIVINLCYMAEKIMRHLGNGSRFGLTIDYSFEGENCLGTGGGIHRTLPLLGTDPFWVVSADLWTDYPFTPIALPTGINAHLIMVANPSFHPQGDYAINNDGRLNHHGNKKTYASMALLTPAFFDDAPGEVFPLSLLIEQAIEKRCISAEYYHGAWFNVGNQAELAKLKQSLAPS